MARMKIIFLVAGFLSTACLFGVPQPTNTPPALNCPGPYCETKPARTVCGEDCSIPASVTPDGAIATTASAASSAKAGVITPGEQADTYWMINPASGANLFIRVTRPPNSADASFPVLMMIPGGIGTRDISKGVDPDNLILAKAGYLVVDFDADGRDVITGEEDYNGYIHQDGLAALILGVAQIPGADPSRLGVISRSYGVTMASGALGRYPDLPVKFYIDWEGPADRFFTTSDCNPNPRGIDWPSCSDDAFWSEREAVAFIGRVRVPYQRIQSQKDHVQPTNKHAVAMINAAVAGGVPWVRLNDYPPNQTYDLDSPPAMFPDSIDRDLANLFLRYAAELFAM